MDFSVLALGFWIYLKKGGIKFASLKQVHTLCMRLSTCPEPSEHKRILTITQSLDVSVFYLLNVTTGANTS